MAKIDTQNVLFDVIAKAVTELDTSGVHISSKADALRDLALAYRYASGGQQPGAITIQKG